jgi:hypothetical protein
MRPLRANAIRASAMTMLPLTTPVVLIIFNRPHTTERVFEAIRTARPRTLFVIADGARADRSGEAELCRATRAVVLDNVDWECDVRTDLSSENLGCAARVVSGLNWVFGQVEQAIILEDDCVPTPSFFLFCESLLERYRDDTRVMAIGGDNFQGGVRRSPYSYHFSKYPYVWGWATWRRAWQRYDPAISSWPTFRRSPEFAARCQDAGERRYWSGCFDRVHGGARDIWDYQWLHAMWLHDGLNVEPEVNMVTNIGVGTGTNLALEDESVINLPTADIWEIKHPPTVAAHAQADRHVYRYLYRGRMRRVFAHFRSGYRKGGTVGLLRSGWQLAALTLRLLRAG